MTFFQSDEYNENKEAPETIKREKNYNKMLWRYFQLLIVIFGVLMFQIVSLIALEMNV